MKAVRPKSFKVMEHVVLYKIKKMLIMQAWQRLLDTAQELNSRTSHWNIQFSSVSK